MSYFRATIHQSAIHSSAKSKVAKGFFCLREEVGIVGKETGQLGKAPQFLCPFTTRLRPSTLNSMQWYAVRFWFGSLFSVHTTERVDYYLDEQFGCWSIHSQSLIKDWSLEQRFVTVLLHLTCSLNLPQPDQPMEERVLNSVWFGWDGICFISIT